MKGDVSDEPYACSLVSEEAVLHPTPAALCPPSAPGPLVRSGAVDAARCSVLPRRLPPTLARGGPLSRQRPSLTLRVPRRGKGPQRGSFDRIGL
jgi:hypothetical protein